MTTEIKLTNDSRLEFGFGTVTSGQEEWMYGEYFPHMAPTMAKHELQILTGFAIVATNFAGGNPQTGSLASWPSAGKRKDLHEDPVFLAIQPKRDAAMDMLSGGHLFQSMDEVITLNTDSDYAIILTADTDLVADPIFILPHTSDSPAQVYAGKSLMLRPWSEADESLLNVSPDVADVFRVRFSNSSQ